MKKIIIAIVALTFPCLVVPLVVQHYAPSSFAEDNTYWKKQAEEWKLRAEEWQAHACESDSQLLEKRRKP